MTSTSGSPVTVVVVTWRAREFIASCLDSLRAQTRPAPVLVIDNASTDGTAEVLARRTDIEVLRLPVNAGFAGGVAAALRHVHTPLIALLNDDAEADPRWLEALHEELDRHPEAAAVTSRLLWAPPRTGVNNAGVELLAGGYGADRGAGSPEDAFPDPTEVFGFSGGAALLRREAVEAVGGFPAEFFLYYEDTDTSWRLRNAGWSIRYSPGAVVRHRHGASSNFQSALFHFHNERNRLLMLVRCAPGALALREICAFLARTATMPVRAANRRGTAPPNVRVGLRIRVLASLAVRLPSAVRHRVRRLDASRSRDVTSRWMRPA